MAPTQCRKRRISGSRHVGVASWDTSTGLIIREHHTVLPLVSNVSAYFCILTDECGRVVAHMLGSLSIIISRLPYV